MKYMILTRAGFAVAVPSDWKTAGAFKRLQRIVNFTVKPSDRIAVDGQIGPKTAKTVLGFLRNQNMDVLPAWDMTPTDQVKSIAENVEDLSAAIARRIGRDAASFSYSNSPGWLKFVFAHRVRVVWRASTQAVGKEPMIRKPSIVAFAVLAACGGSQSYMQKAQKSLSVTYEKTN